MLVVGAGSAGTDPEAPGLRCRGLYFKGKTAPFCFSATVLTPSASRKVEV